MTLEEFKQQYKLKNCSLAKMFGVSEPTIHHWLSGLCKPSSRNAMKIYKRTKGQVSLRDMGL